MIIQAFGFVGTIVDFINMIFQFLAPIMIPIGQVMVIWIEALLTLFDNGIYTWNSLMIYIIIFIVLIVSGIIVNSIWPGDKLSKTRLAAEDAKDSVRLTGTLKKKRTEKSDEEEDEEDKKKKSDKLVGALKSKDESKSVDVKEVEKKCQECDQPIGDSETCPYCGAKN
jgi:hypothetical protein